jgi:hypothetical protein
MKHGSNDAFEKRVMTKIPLIAMAEAQGKT